MFSRFGDAILSWIAFVISVGVFFLLLPGLISISYHPIAPGIHLIPVRIVLSAIGVLACFVLAIRHSTVKHRTPIVRNACEIAAIPAVLWIVFQFTAVIYQQSDHLHLTYRGDTYAIPRVYSPGEWSERNSFEVLNVSICNKTYAPVYAKPCNAYSYVELDTRPITGQFDAYTALDQAGATYAGDVITEKGTSANTLDDKSFTIDRGGRINRFLLNETGRIERFASCFVVTKSCTISVRTPHGILSFPARTEDAGASEFWRDEEKYWLATFDSWKCTGATCEGRLD